MTAKILYIIGNGFDLWHGLPTTYKHFYSYARETLDEIEKYFSSDAGDDELWYDFENNLGHFKSRVFYRDHDNTDPASDDFRPSHAYSLEDDLTQQSEDLVVSLQEIFREWIGEIDVSDAVKRIEFSSENRFFSFNYTSTLQRIYGIKNSQVFHIHGNIDEHDELIFGHGKEFTEEPELDEEGNSNRTIFSDAEGASRYPLYAFRKPVKEVLCKNKHIFESQKDVGQIIIIGHSLNDIDIPYFKKLAGCATHAHWLVLCYEASDYLHHKEQLIRCGVTPERIQTRSYTEFLNTPVASA
jgi:Bacteriophage abortive infection AbiH